MEEPIRRQGRLLAIGDIHGCGTALTTLLKELAPRAGDTIVTLGDVVDRGPDTPGVLDRLILLSSQGLLVPIKGNHEVMLLGCVDGGHNPESWLYYGGAEVLEAYGVSRAFDLPEHHLEFLRRFRLFHETETDLFVHANYHPLLALADQPEDILLWMPVLAEEAVRHRSGKTAFVGHTPQADGQILDLGFLVGLDTNCCRGGWLTGLDVRTGAYWQTNEKGQVRTGRRQAVRVEGQGGEDVNGNFLS